MIVVLFELWLDWFSTRRQRRRDILRTHSNDHGGRGAVPASFDVHIDAYEGRSDDGTSDTSA